MKTTGKIIPLAFPDLFVKLSDEKRILVLRWFGLGTKTHIKAGHAALVLVEGTTGELHYFDFGRYVTPKGKGRVRSKLTDVEVEMPMKAIFNEQGDILNLNDIFIWLQANPKITHGGGRMIASVGDVNVENALAYVTKLQNMGSIPYKAFGMSRTNIDTNCSRLVTDTILQGISDPKIHRRLKCNKRFTPSPIGNVEITANGSAVYEVEDAKVVPYKSTAFKENMVNFFDKDIPESVYTEVEQPMNTTLLKGVGSNAYFKLEETSQADIFTVTRYNHYGEKDFSGDFKTMQLGFNFNKNYKFVYDSHCLYCHIEQDGKRFKFDRIFKNPSSL